MMQYGDDNLNNSCFDDIESQKTQILPLFAKIVSSDFEKCLFEDDKSLNSGQTVQIAEDEDDI